MSVERARVQLNRIHRDRQYSLSLDSPLNEGTELMLAEADVALDTHGATFGFHGFNKASTPSIGKILILA
jgi:hypothetical protein